MTIRNIVLSISFLLFATFSVVAQGGPRGKIKALKTAYITNALELTSAEAEKFWPIYNEFDRNIHQIKTVKGRLLAGKIIQAGGLDNLSDAEADKILQEFIDIDFNVANEKKKLKERLKGIISAKKIIKLFRTEQEFNKELLKRLRDNRRANSPKRN